MDTSDLLTLTLTVVLLVLGWTAFVFDRRSLPRIWAILARKPHATRRAHVLRLLVYYAEVNGIIIPGLTAMLAAGLLAWYLIQAKVWADLTGVAVFLSTGVSVLVAWGVREARLMRRLALSCSTCELGFVGKHEYTVTKTGQCPRCATVLFRTPGKRRSDG